MILDLEIKRARRADTAHLDIVCFRLSGRHAVMRQVGHVQQQLLQLGLNPGQRCFVRLQLLADTCNLGHDGGNVLALRFGDADAFGSAVASGLQILRAGLHHLALVLEPGEGFRIELETAFLQGSHNAVEVVAQCLTI